MVGRKTRAFATRLVLVWFFALAALTSECQAGLSRGSMSGTVYDSSGAAIGGAQITIKSASTATNRGGQSGADGTFSIRDLPSGTYAVVISAPGFGKYRNDSVAIAVGRDSFLDVWLPLAAANAEVTVHASTSSVDVSQASPVTNIDRDRIEELPIPSRNYLNFTLLAPSMSAANPALGIQAPATVENGFSAGGLRPSSNALFIDGSDDNDEYTGLSRTELSPEAISDFQVINHGYAAQFGGSAGGAVDVETRSGADLQHGDAFLFVQNGTMNATPPLENAFQKPDESRLRAGLSTGGAFKPAKMFYYTAAEQEMARGEEASDLSPQLVARIHRALSGQGPLRGFQLHEGFFPTTNQEMEFSIRADRPFAKSSLMVRYALTNNRSVNDAFNTDDLSDVSARGSAFYDDNGVNGSWSTTFSPQLVNQLTLEVAQRRVVQHTGTEIGPGVIVEGIAQFGKPYTGNSRRYETHVDLGDNVIRQSGKHLVQAGFTEEAIALRASVGDGFGGVYIFPSVPALENAQPDFYIQSFGNSDTNFRAFRTAGYVQDQWTPRHGLTLAYGLRYEYNHLPAPLSQDALNLSPRLGFAWSPEKQWVLRGGFGTFFDRYLLSSISRIEEFDGRRAQQQIVEGAGAASLYQSGSIFTVPHSGIAPSIWAAQPKLRNPYAVTASLGLERALPADWTISGEYRFVHGVLLGRTVNTNLTPPTILTATNAASLGILAPTPQQLGRLVFAEQRRNPAYDAVNEFQTAASSSYNGATLTLNRQFAEEFELMAGYTYSHTIDDASLDTEQPQNPYDPGAERAASLNDQRHRFVLSGLYVVGPDLDDPQDRAKAMHPGTLQKIVNGLEFAPILAVDSGFRNNPLTGTDSNREHIYPFPARPLELARNGLKTPAVVSFDLRVLKMVPIWRGHLDIVAESFNLLNRRNVSLLNAVYGSDLQAASSFAHPIQEADPRRIQFSLDFEY